MKADIEVGAKLAELLRSEFMSVMEQLSSEFEKKHFKSSHKFETFTL